MNSKAWIQRWIHTYKFWHIISWYSLWSWIHIWIHIMNSYKISWSWIHMPLLMTYEFMYEFLFVKNIGKSFFNPTWNHVYQGSRCFLGKITVLYLGTKILRPRTERQILIKLQGQRLCDFRFLSWSSFQLIEIELMCSNKQESQSNVWILLFYSSELVMFTLTPLWSLIAQKTWYEAKGSPNGQEVFLEYSCSGLKLLLHLKF